MRTSYYFFSHFALHAHEAGDWESLFLEIDENDFLMEQAAHLQGYAQGSRDLEQFALPGAIEREDWDRFVRYGLIAVNLRSLAESLAEEEVLAGLALQGQILLARNLVDQLADVGTRAAARAALASHLPEEGKKRAVQEVLDELRALPEPRDPDAAEAVCRALLAVTRFLAPDLLNAWPPLLERLEGYPDLRNRVWLAVADGCRDDSVRSQGFLAALRRIDDHRLLTGILPAWLAEPGAADPGLVREAVRDLADPTGSLLWECLLTALAQQSQADPEAALERWSRERLEGPAVPWSTALLEAGGALFAELGPDAADRLARELPDDSTRTLFWIVRLEGQPTPERTREALQAVRQRPAGEQLHGMIRVLAAWPEKESAERRRWTLAVIAHLVRLRYAAPAADLRRFLELVADALPGELRHQVESVLWSPAGSPELLEALAEQALSPALLDRLAEDAESHAMIACPNEAEAFELRSRLLIRLGCRLALLPGGSACLARISERLLPEERDELYARVARLLHEDRRPDDAAGALVEIRSPRLRAKTEFAIQAKPRDDGQPFDPGALYRAVATVGFAEDERLALLALSQPPVDAESLLDTLLMPMHDRERQAQAVIDLARSTLELERRFLRRDQRDPLGPRQLVRHTLSATGSDERLLALSLDLLDLAAPLAPSGALVELRETLDTAVLGLEQVSWPARHRAVAGLLRRIRPVLLNGVESVDRCRAAAEGIAAFMTLAEREEGAPGLRDLKAHWDEVLVLVAATVERLPPLVRLTLEHPLRVRIWGQWLPNVSRLAGWERSWRSLSWLESHLVPPRLRERLQTPWALGGEAFLGRWSWLDGEQKDIARLCFAGPEQRREHAEALLAEPAPPPRILRGLTYLLSTTAPELACELASKLSGPGRDELCLDLIRDGWISSPHIQDLTSRIGDRELQLTAAVCRPGDLAGGTERASWTRDLCELVSRQAFDPADPALWPVLRRLRTAPPAEARAPLATAFLEALRQGGRQPGEKALRVWLNAHLGAPRQELPEAAPTTFERSRDAIRQSIRLASPEAGEGKDPRPGQGIGREERERLSRFYRRWTRTMQSSGERRLPWLESAWLEPASVLALCLTLMFLDVVFMPPSALRGATPSRLYPPLSVLLALGLANALLIGEDLRTRFGQVSGPLPRTLRFLLSGVPLLGPYALSLLYGSERWGRVLFPGLGSQPGAKPALSGRFSTSRPVRCLLRRIAWTARRLTSPWGLAVWLTINTALLMLCAGRLATAPGGVERRLALAIGVILHLLAFAALVASLWRRSRRDRLPTSRLAFGIAASGLTLAPVPLLPLLGQFLALLVLPGTAESSMTRTLRSRRSSARGLPQWLPSVRLLQSSLERANWRKRLRRPVFDVAREPIEASWQLLNLYQLKSTLLHFEAAAFSWGLLWLTGQKVHGVPALQLLWLLVVITSPALAVAGLLLTLLRFARGILRGRGPAVSPEHRPWYLLMAVSQLAFLSGLGAGALLFQGNGRALGGLLVVTGAVGIVTLLPPLLLSLVLPIPPSSERSDQRRTLWMLGFAMIALAGIGIQQHPAAQALYRGLYYRLGLFCPVLALVPAAVGLRWLLRPFQPRHVLDHDRPLQDRALLAFLTVTAALPLGGLAVPIWIHIRERRWPPLAAAEMGRRLNAAGSAP